MSRQKPLRCILLLHPRRFRSGTNKRPTGSDATLRTVGVTGCDFLERFANDARRLDHWPGLLVGDMSQPRGGPMVTGHTSHQIGLDVDIWLTPMPDRILTPQERENITAVSMLKDPFTVDPDKWTPLHTKLIKRAASYPEVDRIFVHPAIKKVLCEQAGNDRRWLAKVRPWWNHYYHFHVRVKCSPGPATVKAKSPRAATMAADRNSLVGSRSSKKRRLQAPCSRPRRRANRAVPLRWRSFRRSAAQCLPLAALSRCLSMPAPCSRRS